MTTPGCRCGAPCSFFEAPEGRRNASLKGNALACLVIIFEFSHDQHQQTRKEKNSEETNSSNHSKVLFKPFFRGNNEQFERGHGHQLKRWRMKIEGRLIVYK
ncbi:hypothetical protein RHMOL_Rhmol13G0188200 [Rhododendron molle]|uniref:Uncharacterized protein n=1 Tax=Rhododendron molle TaxID=49168 RepID=A0ACC0L9W9_RHOML|nr:hypothetical protein RHMOL_Rhmol13G0188200 [Rhododendron molle]